jgi:hypothetical protein
MRLLIGGGGLRAGGERSRPREHRADSRLRSPAHARLETAGRSPLSEAPAFSFTPAPIGSAARPKSSPISMLSLIDRRGYTY